MGVATSSARSSNDRARSTSASRCASPRANPARACASCQTRRSAALSNGSNNATARSASPRTRWARGHGDLGVRGSREDVSGRTPRPGQQFVGSVQAAVPAAMSPARSCPNAVWATAGSSPRVRANASSGGHRRERVEGALIVTEIFEHRAETDRRPREPEPVGQMFGDPKGLPCRPNAVP